MLFDVNRLDFRVYYYSLLFLHVKQGIILEVTA